jgi:hypothetical protein|tara:strand:+ start:709 stop:975 length:267 start_codon:yes stop_codon:yes gene_type:complete
VDDQVTLKVGDIVTESELIVPAERNGWNGLIIDVEKNAWVFSTIYHPEAQDKITVLWLDTGIREDLPASVVILIYRAEKDFTEVVDNE